MSIHFFVEGNDEIALLSSFHHDVENHDSIRNGDRFKLYEETRSNIETCTYSTEKKSIFLKTKSTAAPIDTNGEQSLPPLMDVQTQKKPKPVKMHREFRSQSSSELHAARGGVVSSSISSSSSSSTTVVVGGSQQWDLPSARTSHVPSSQQSSSDVHSSGSL